VTDVVKTLSFGRTKGDSNTANIVGVAKKPLIVTVYRNQLIIKSPRFLLKGRRKMQSILNLDKDILQISVYVR
jgi:hypothetical protein